MSLNGFDVEEYNATSELDRASILAEITPDMVLSNMSDQLSSFGSSFVTFGQQDYLALYEDRINMLIQEHDDIDFQRELMAMRDVTYDKVIETILSIYEIDYDENANTNKASMAKILYHFFVLDYQDNLIEMYVNYIMKYKKNIFNEYGERLPKVSPDLKKTYKDNKDAFIIGNISYLMDEFFSKDELDEDPISLIANRSSDPINIQIKTLFDDHSLSMNYGFYKSFIQFIDTGIGVYSIIPEILSGLNDRFVANTTLEGIITK